MRSASASGPCRSPPSGYSKPSRRVDSREVQQGSDCHRASSVAWRAQGSRVGLPGHGEWTSDWCKVLLPELHHALPLILFHWAETKAADNDEHRTPPTRCG